MAETNLLGCYDLETPAVPGSHPAQRWFGRKGNRVDGFDVFRDAEQDFVDVGLQFLSGDGYFKCDRRTTADELRRMAAQLLSAAQDLEQHPAADLRAELLASKVKAEALA